MPTYRRKHLIGRAIQSALAQTEPDWELIIVDDCPEDPAEAEVKKFADPRIRYIKHDRNKGGAAARNTAMAVSHGAYIGFLDDDDEWLPEKINVQLAELEKTTERVGYCFSGSYLLTEKNETVTHVPSGQADYFEQLVQNFNLFLGLTIMIRRQVYEQIGGWSEQQPSHQEIEWMFRVSQAFEGMGIDRPLVRAYSGSIHDHIGSNLQKRISGRKQLLERYDDVFRSRPSAYIKHHFLLAMWYRDVGNYLDAAHELENVLAIKWNPRSYAHLLLVRLKMWTNRYVPAR